MREPVRAVWLEVLHRYLAIIKRLREDMRTATTEAIDVTTATNTPQSNIGEASVAQIVDLSTPLERLNALEAVFTSFLEEVIGQMAGHVPLQSIATAVIDEYGKDAFGDFRTTLLSLLGVCNFELSILRCASRVTGSDTVALLQQGYKECMRPETLGGSYSGSLNSSGVYGTSDYVMNNGTDAPGSSRNTSGTGNRSSMGFLFNGDGMTNDDESAYSSGMGPMMMSLSSARQRGQEAWTKATAAAGPAASTLLEKISFPQGAVGPTGSA